MASPTIFDDLRAALDPPDVAEGEGLGRKGRDFDCPHCARPGKARSRDGRGWFCIKCKVPGDSVDIIAAVRGIDRGAALRVACELAGLDRRGSGVDTVAPRAPRLLPTVSELAGAELDARLRVIRLAALHYRLLSGWCADDDGDIRSRLDHLVYMVKFDAHLIPGIIAAAGIAQAYLVGRVGVTPADPLAELVGVCPSRRTGLREHLLDMGGEPLADVGRRAGLLRADGSDSLAGRVVFIWTDAAGGVVGLTGRAVPDLAWPGAPKVLALPVHGTGADPETGIPRCGVPFGLHLALRLPGSILIVEGETAALAALRDGVPAVATGGISRTRAEHLAAALGERLADATVVFDCESDPDKQLATDARAEAFAAELGCRWLPSWLRRSA
jgi:hypothetical protein